MKRTDLLHDLPFVRNNARLCLLLVLSGLPTSVLAQPISAPLISPIQFAVNGLSEGSGEDAILAAFGRPDSVQQGVDEPTGGMGKTFYYALAKVYTIDGKVVEIKCRMQWCRTFDGVNVGSRREEVLHRYGISDAAAQALGDTIPLWVEKADVALVFHLRDQRVVEIELWTAYF